MPLLSHDKAIKEYWEEFKKDNPDIDIDFNHFEGIIKGFFNAVKKWIAQPFFPVVVIKYLVKFKVFPKNLTILVFENNKRLRLGEITEEEHKKIDDYFKLYLKELNKEKDDVEIVD